MCFNIELLHLIFFPKATRGSACFSLKGKFLHSQVHVGGTIKPQHQGQKALVWGNVNTTASPGNESGISCVGGKCL